MLVLMAAVISFQVGCAALQDRVEDFAKTQGIKILASQLDRVEEKVEKQVAAVGLENKKIKDSISKLVSSLTGAEQDPGAILTSLKSGLDSMKDETGSLQWYGLLAAIFYAIKQAMEYMFIRPNQIKKHASGTGNGSGAS